MELTLKLAMKLTNHVSIFADNNLELRARTRVTAVAMLLMILAIKHPRAMNFMWKTFVMSRNEIIKSQRNLICFKLWNESMISKIVACSE